MRELTADLFLTVDGWAKGTRSTAFFGYAGPELQAWIDEQSAAPHLLLMGATTYRTLAEVSAATGDTSMDAQPKVVFSGSLRAPLSWAGTTLETRDVADAVPELKSVPGDPLRVIGSLSLVRSLVRLGLVDRLRLLVFPQILGRTGAERGLLDLPDVDLDLAGTRVLDGRLVLLDYRVKPGHSSHT
jgi:dihydrofolate reductase